MKQKQTSKQAGFTLIELVMVIVILGILAAVAMPKFVDLSNDARNAAVAGAAGALSSAAVINYATVGARGTNGAGVIRLNVSSAGAALMAGITMDTATFKITGNDATACSAITNAGSGYNITLYHSGGTGNANSAVATIICTG